MSIEVMKQALDDVCGAKLCEVNSMSSRQEMLRLMDKAITALRTAIEQTEKQEPVARAWDEGYRDGINDERMSEANIGIAGFGAKVEPARNNPYRTTPPAAHVQEPLGLIESMKDAQPCCGQYETCHRACTPRGKFIGQRDAQRELVGLTEEEIDEAQRLAHIRHQKHKFSIRGQQITPADDPQWHYARAIEAALMEKNT